MACNSKPKEKVTKKVTKVKGSNVITVNLVNIDGVLYKKGESVVLTTCQKETYKGLYK